MTGNTHDIIIFGEGGDWLNKNRSALTRQFDNPLFVGEKGWQDKTENAKAPVALIMTPPATHLEICQKLLNNSAVTKIYCEKPFPDIEALLEDVDDENERVTIKEKVIVLDHYLLKYSQEKLTSFEFKIGRNRAWRLAQRYLGRWYFRPTAYNPFSTRSFPENFWQTINHSIVFLLITLFRLFSFFTGWVPVKYIEIDLKEKEDENRPWMKTNDDFGGVVYDLGHHTLAILLRIFGKRALENVRGKDITIKKVSYFGGDKKDAISEVSFLISIARCTVRINLAKSSVNTSKKIALFKKFMTHAKPNRTYSLTEGIKTDKQPGYDYADNFNDNNASRLNFEETTVINKICSRVIDLAHHVKSKQATHNLDDMDLINNLSDQFKHRHAFYWQSYYKLVIYQVIILLAPYAFAMNFAKDKAQSGLFGPGTIIFLLTVAISMWIYYWGVQRVTAVLSEEHIRMKVVHDRMKELLNKTRIDLSVISINESSISDVMLIQYRFLIRGFCVLNPFVIYFLFEKQVGSTLSSLWSSMISLF